MGASCRGGAEIMKVLLIYPDTDRLSVIPRKLINIEPLGLEYLAGIIPEHQVRILDMKIENNWQSQVQEFCPDVVGVSGTVIHFRRMLEILRGVKKLSPMTLTVVATPLSCRATSTGHAWMQSFWATASCLSNAYCRISSGRDPLRISKDWLFPGEVSFVSLRQEIPWSIWTISPCPEGI
jgi:hypothetical protein